MTNETMFLISEELLLDRKASVSGSKDEGFRMRFEFLKADTPSTEKRVYPKKVLAKAVEEGQARIESGRPLPGSTSHVKDGLEINQVSHLLERLYMDGSSAWTEAHLLPTQRGRNLMAIIRGGISLGVSARGVGSLTKVEDKQIVNEGYVLTGVDFVLDPSMGTYANQSNIFESQEFAEDVIPSDLWASEIIGHLLKGGLSKASLQRRYEDAVRYAAYKGNLKEYLESMNAEGVDEKRLSALFQGAIKAGYKNTFLEFKKSYLGRKS